MSSQLDAATRPSDAEIQAMLARAVRLYAERVAESRSCLARFPARRADDRHRGDGDCNAMLKAVNLQVFELGMWQAWSGRQ